MQIERTKAEVGNVNSRPEGSGEGMTYASDISLRLSAPRAVIDKMVPTEVAFLDQFYAGDDPVLEVLYPIKWNKKIKDLRATIYYDDDQELVFEACRIQTGMEITPQAGEYVEIVFKLQVHPQDETESGRLDFLAKRWVDVEIEPLNLDTDD